MVHLVHGVGINDRSCPAKIEGKNTKEYYLWVGMLERCYSKAYLEKRPTYVGCSVSDNFKNYSYFYSWCKNQVGFNVAGFSLDKDLLCKGNKQYSETHCVFIPNTINLLLTNCKAARGVLPIGVTKAANKFRAQCTIEGINKYIGLFDTPTLAFEAYKAFKEDNIKHIAEKYKAIIDHRAYLALLNYEVSIDD